MAPTTWPATFGSGWQTGLLPTLVITSATPIMEQKYACCAAVLDSIYLITSALLTDISAFHPPLAVISGSAARFRNKTSQVFGVWRFLHSQLGR